MDIRTTIAHTVERLSAEPVGPPRMAAETLLMHVLGCDRAYLHAHPENELSADELQLFEAAVARRAAGEPLQYITGHQEFYSLDFLVTPAVLIPRPETENLVEAALGLIRKCGNTKPRIVDVGTGSGCIILSIAHELQKPPVIAAELQALDISPAALAVARENAKRLSLDDSVKFHEGDLLAPFASETASYDFILSNPPYVGRGEQDKVQKEVREHEPAVAVFAGEHGLDIYRRLIPQAHKLLKPGGWLLLEIGYSMKTEVLGLFNGWAETRTIPDLQGIPRVVIARK